MDIGRTLTSTVYIVNNNKVLLHMHKKHNSLFPIGGHMEAGELPEQTALREVYEECGLEVKLYNSQNDLGMTRVNQLLNPQYTLLENIGHELENIDFIYFATTEQTTCSPQNGEACDFYWLSSDDIKSNPNIKEHIKLMAIEALATLAK